MFCSLPSLIWIALVSSIIMPRADAVETINVLVVLVQWADHTNRPLIPRSDIDQFWNGPGSSNLIPGESVAEYIASNSYGKYELKATVLDWIRASATEAQASNGAMGESANGNDIEDSLAPVLQTAADQGLDLSPFVDANSSQLKGVVFMHSGYAAETYQVDCETLAGHDNRIKSKSWGVVEYITAGSRRYTLSTFITVSAYRGWCNSQIAGVGIPIHEWMHAKYELDDLYDTGGRYMGSRNAVGGIGGYGVMSYAGGQRITSVEQYPGIMSPYSKIKAGYLDPIDIEVDGTYTVRAAELFPDIYKISIPYEQGEYLLIENRQPLLSDKQLWSPGGIVIYHVDENIDGYGNYVRGGPFLEGWPSNGAHYKVAILQADGAYELEKAENLGHNADFWTQGDILGPGNGELVASAAGTYPNTDSYVNGNIRVTGLVLDNFKDEGDGVWSFQVTGLPTSPTGPSPTGPPNTGGGGDTPTTTPNAGGGGGDTPTATTTPGETPTDTPDSAAASYHLLWYLLLFVVGYGIIV